MRKRRPPKIRSWVFKDWRKINILDQLEAMMLGSKLNTIFFPIWDWWCSKARKIGKIASIGEVGWKLCISLVRALGLDPPIFFPRKVCLQRGLQMPGSLCFFPPHFNLGPSGGLLDKILPKRVFLLKFWAHTHGSLRSTKLKEPPPQVCAQLFGAAVARKEHSSRDLFGRNTSVGQRETLLRRGTIKNRGLEDDPYNMHS